MAKEITAKIKLQVPAGKANPAPPVGPALGQHGVNIMEFCKTFNARTQKLGDTIVPVIISVYSDRSFTFITKTPPAAELLKKAAGIVKGSGIPNKDKVGKVTRAQIKEIATDQDARSERGNSRIGNAHDRRLGQEHGPRSSRLISGARFCRLIWLDPNIEYVVCAGGRQRPLRPRGGNHVREEVQGRSSIGGPDQVVSY